MKKQYAPIIRDMWGNEVTPDEERFWELALERADNAMEDSSHYGGYGWDGNSWDEGEL